MNKIYILLILSIGCLLSKAQNTSPSVFIKNYHNYKIDTTLTVAIHFKDKFYCLKSTGEILVVDGINNTIDESYKDNSQQLQLQYIYVKNDTIIGINKTSIYFLNKNKWTFLRNGYEKSSINYEDEKFIVTSTCNGEWGGSLYFLNKKTKKIYECECTCAVNLIKNDNKYFVTSSLSHLSGSTNIFEIPDPLKLKKYNREYLKAKKVIYVGDEESKSQIGKSKIVDSIGITTATSFIFHSTIYYLVEKYKKVTLDTVKGGRLTPIEDFSKLNIWADYPTNQTYNNQEITTFNNNKNSGFLFIDKNKLSFYIFNRHN